MRIEQLQYLLEIAKTHSISLAAENLYVTQPAISNAIKKLEDELGATLFTRSKNGVYLTAVGKDILDAAQKTIEQAQRIEHIVEEHKYSLNANLAGTLNLHLVPPINMWALPEVIPIFSQRHPQATLSIMENNPSEIIKDLASNHYDLSIFSTIDPLAEQTLSEFATDRGHYCVEYLSSHRLYASVSADSPLAKQPSISLKELAKLPLGTLSYTQNDHDYLTRVLQDFPESSIVFRTNNIHMLIEQISKGHCVSISTFSERFIQQLAQKVALIPVSNALKLTFYYSYHPANPLLPLIKSFLQILKAKL